MHKDIIVRQLPNFINGEFVETGDTFDILYPITGEVTAQAHKAGQKRSTPRSRPPGPRLRARGASSHRPNAPRWCAPSPTGS